MVCYLARDTTENIWFWNSIHYCLKHLECFFLSSIEPWLIHTYIRHFQNWAHGVPWQNPCSLLGFYLAICNSSLVPLYPIHPWDCCCRLPNTCCSVHCPHHLHLHFLLGQQMSPHWVSCFYSCPLCNVFFVLFFKSSRWADILKMHIWWKRWITRFYTWN